ncbi:MAG TPA: hypothetical protein PK473_03145 [Nitrosomonas sp.]|nr:hypothetical protein [Agitococcus sp.]HNA70007.1 hypothetical protein [Nitrosomonas sp.]
MKNTIQIQWEKFVKSGFNASRFTKDLYEAMYKRGRFIAHYSREGFHKERFLTVDGLDFTFLMMREVKELKELLYSVDTEELIKAKLMVARIEVDTLNSQIEVLKHHVQKIKDRYKPEVFRE